MKISFLSVLLLFLSLPAAQGRDIRMEMKAANELGKRASGLVTRNEIRPFWGSDGSSLVYRVNIGKDETQFVKVDLKTGAKSVAFDHVRLARALSKEGKSEVKSEKLPLDQVDLSADGIFRISALGRSWKFSVEDYRLLPDDRPPVEAELLAPEEARRRSGAGGGASRLTIENRTRDGIEIFWLNGDRKEVSYGKIAAGARATQSTYSGHLWLIKSSAGEELAAVETPTGSAVASITGKVKAPPKPKRDLSPDGKWRAFLREGNAFVEPAGVGTSRALSSGNSEGYRFAGPMVWSPDSKRLVVFRVKPVETRKIHIVESSPSDQVQPKLRTLDYAKPGDPIEQPMPHFFDVDTGGEIPVDSALFENPWRISDVSWNKDSSEFLLVYNQRGHQVMRIVGVNAVSGVGRSILEEKSETFIDYSQKYFFRHFPKTGEILWASERDGFNHLYLIDAQSGAIKDPVTKGNWNVREVLEVDEEKRQLLLKIMGVEGQEPYHMHFARVNFDGSGFLRLTEGDGNHAIDFSPDGKYFIDTWSRVDLPPVTGLRNAMDGTLVAELEKADDSALTATGWSRPERLVAKGRDGQTDIYGVIIRPTHFDPSKKYPVLENIYAGPHDFFVPKKYSAWSQMNAMAELGFIVVKIDGMGTNWRSRAFHDVCWKNLSDGGFPDRIPWIKAAAESREWMDLSRVGIYGGSAGGQNALAGLLFHGDFYHAGVADCGCHDNRMDKVWWNEAWMGWPVDESYERNSNVTNAAKLTGKLLLIVGELDSNVDPASTAQVVNALQKAEKDFEFVPLMNANHGAAETPYGSYRRAEFLLRTLVEPQ
jgi:dipeptidyl-peptidase 4